MGESELLTQAEVAKYLKISTKTLEAMRQKGNGPVFHKFGRRVLYKKSTLTEYLDKHSFGSTSEYH
ncbi:helix-turn-helix transcriptional regulator [Mesorhizobium silamurunense]|uniref:helix-turn-helix transcriptional regulator n=1 Tax=Mesorhizobium silamurunense TaxID=499528 RepID=UPI00178059EF|nr:helix-turn-helix domain-containing protein [Mesorhizobium silamurunense]